MVMDKGGAAGGAANERKSQQLRVQFPRGAGLKISQAHRRFRPAVKPHRSLPELGGLKQDFIGGHVVRAVVQGEWHKPADYFFHRKIGSLAALTSSGRLTGMVCGALCKNSASSFSITSKASANASNVSLLSVSVGSIMIASGTTSGKYTVGAWKPKSRRRLAMSMALIFRVRFNCWALATNSCMQRSPCRTSYACLIQARR